MNTFEIAARDEKVAQVLAVIPAASSKRAAKRTAAMMRKWGQVERLTFVAFAQGRELARTTCSALTWSMVCDGLEVR